MFLLNIGKLRERTEETILEETYTVGHKNGATFIFAITVANVDRFQ